MPATVLLKEFDPWHPTDQTGFNKVGYLTENGVVIYPRRSRITKKSFDAIKKRPHRIIQLTSHPRAKEIETFFTGNIVNTALFVTGIQMIGQPASPFWDSPITDHTSGARGEVEYLSEHVTKRGLGVYFGHGRHREPTDNVLGSGYLEPCW
jgi:hypothetical protein